MSSSLRSRFSLTFAMLIGIVLCMAGLMMLLVVRNIPIRTTTIRLQELSRIITSQEELDDLTLRRQAEILKQVASFNDVRILLANTNGAILFDSGSDAQPKLKRLPQRYLNTREDDRANNGTFRDANQRQWQFILTPLDKQLNLILAAPQPPIQSNNILRDDLLPPLLWVAGFTLLLAVLLAGLTARWVSQPLGEMVEATRHISDGKIVRLQENGPQEVKQLARAFNEMNAQVAAGKRSQQDFVANVSHELKTPLTAIRGFAQAIVDGTASSDDEIDQAAGVIYNEAGRMHSLVLDLLDLARIEGGTLSFTRDPVNLAALLENLVLKFTLFARESQIELAPTLPDLPQLIGDGDRLMQVFSNLLDNAIKHSPEGGRVEIKAEQQGNYVLVHFIDSGPGIPEDEQARIFERFYQLDKARAHTSQAGFGLGLAIAEEIAHAHGGEIFLESHAGQGSDFVVKLPFTPGVGAEQTPNS